MLFAIIGYDGPEGAALRPKVRPVHLEHLRPYVAAGKVRLAGPFTDGSGSLIVIDVETEAAAIEFSQRDPYFTEGVFERVEVKPFRQVFPE
ncbi:MAG: YciI family protein [Candidatus Binatus sp.]|uniref:YciI family protein n=1 Tax=Candidatus Binatus sp. TaxID=2811406 RepID=UPI002715A598|nr:YciI family protein [Candidatus Binatus sp.]MDO8434819.1 YciI family protein [Candidatus Binatus sp.]